MIEITHRLLAQGVRLLETRPNGCIVQFEDGSINQQPIPHDELVSVEAVGRCLPEIERLIDAAITRAQSTENDDKIPWGHLALCKALDAVRPGWRSDD